jgi:hypothetical protein
MRAGTMEAVNAHKHGRRAHFFVQDLLDSFGG